MLQGTFLILAVLHLLCAMAEIGTDIEKAKALLAQGQLVGIPTETVYGLAANALDADAVARIFEVKKRPHFDPLIVHLHDPTAIGLYAREIPDTAREIAKQFWPGPVTIVLPKRAVIPDIVTSGLDTVALRCPAHPLAQELLAAIDFPLAAPSANPFGYVSPTTAQHVNDQLGREIGYILDGGPCAVGLESTIVGFEPGPVIYRRGGLGVEEIERVVGKVGINTILSSNPKAPGQLASHYAPRARLIIGDIDVLLKQFDGRRSGVLTFSRDFNLPYQRVLSKAGSLREAARNLFSALRDFDNMPVDTIIGELVPDEGLGKAINDRLQRAANN